MKKAVKEVCLLDVEDIEKAICARLGKTVTLAEVDCTLVYFAPEDWEVPAGVCLDFEVNGESFRSDELFEGACLDGHRLALAEAAPEVDEIFNFDVSVFKSFDVWTDTSD